MRLAALLILTLVPCVEAQRLTHAGHYFALDGRPWIRVGAGSPENLLVNGFAPQGGYAGAFDYLQSVGVNSIYVSIFGGDDPSVNFFINRNPALGVNVGKFETALAVFAEANARGIECHVFLRESESEWSIGDESWLGPRTTAYYDAVVPRLAQLPMITINVGEECNYPYGVLVLHLAAIRARAPRTPIALHTWRDRLPDARLYGRRDLDSISLQATAQHAGALAARIASDSADAGWPLVVTFDEASEGYTGPEDLGWLRPAWEAVLAAPGGGYALYGGNPETGAIGPCGDLTCNDFRWVDEAWRAMRATHDDFVRGGIRDALHAPRPVAWPFDWNADGAVDIADLIQFNRRELN